MADGSVIIKVDADEKAAVKKLQQVEREIDKLREKLNEKQSGRSALVQESERLQAQISRLRQQAKAENMKWQGGDAAAGQRESELLAKIPALKKKMEEVNLEIDKYDQKISEITGKLQKQESIYADTQKEVAALSKQNTAMARATAQAQDHMERFANRVKKLAKQVFIFTVISAAFRELRDVMDVAVRGNEEASAAFARLKGALLTLVQPLVSLLLPALTWLANALTRVISVLAQLFSMLTGKSFASTKQAAKNLNEQKKALEGVGSAAEEAKGSLAGFDEINAINTTESGGGGGLSEAIQPDFEFGGDMEMDNLKNILRLVEMIGLAFLAWKLSDSFLGGMKTFLGLLIAVEGAIYFVRNFVDAWKNGIDWENLKGMLGGILAVITGLAIAFGAVGAGIGALVGGLAMLVLGFKDAFTNGWNMKNLLTSIAGILLTGVGIGLLVGSWIPLLIAGIAAVLLYFTVAYGEGENLLAGIKQMLQGFIDFFVGLFTGDIDRAVQGIKDIFDGLKTAVFAVWDGLTKSFVDFLDNIDKMTGGVLHNAIQNIKTLFEDMASVVRTLLGDISDFFRDVFVGITEFISGVFSGDMEKALKGIAQIFRSIFNLVISACESAVNFIISGVNNVIRGLKKLLSVGDVLGLNLGKNISEIPRVSLKRIPALATGTVVPPNREFLAMLGDNKTETEVVSPLSTMKQAMMEALAESGGGGGEITLHLYLNGRKMAVEVVKEINNMTREAGKPVLLF